VPSTRAPAPRASLASASLALTLGLGASTLACSSSPPRAPAASPSPVLHVRSKPQTNGGKTFYVMVREADSKSITLSYDEASGKLFADPPDPAVVASQPLFPGTDATLSLDGGGGKKDLVVYFFFTDPSPKWRLPLRRPLPSQVSVELGASQIDRVQPGRP
jgi:hypothetical protein